jgi:hypothetical protein
MGVAWILEIIVWAINPSVRGKIPLYWIIFDFVTLIQAIAIFVIFICRRDVVENLITKYPFLQSKYKTKIFANSNDMICK